MFGAGLVLFFALVALLADVIATHDPEQRHRITSYNVCYTKLLRLSER